LIRDSVGRFDRVRGAIVTWQDVSEFLDPSIRIESDNYYVRMGKKKKLHHSSHIRLIRWTRPVSRDTGQHNQQTDITSVCSVPVGHKPGVRVTTSGHSAKQPPGRAQMEPSRITTPVYEGESTVWSNQRDGQQNSRRTCDYSSNLPWGERARTYSWTARERSSSPFEPQRNPLYCKPPYVPQHLPSEINPDSLPTLGVYSDFSNA